MNNTIANPFQDFVVNRLEVLEDLLRSFTNPTKQEASTKEVTYSVPELCEKYELTKATIYKHYANGEGKLKGYKQAGKLFFIESDVIEWIKSGSVTSPIY